MIAYRHTVVDGMKIFYREAGPKTAPALLLLHGLSRSVRSTRWLWSTDNNYLINGMRD